MYTSLRRINIVKYYYMSMHMIHTHSYIAYLLLDISKYATLDYIHPYMGTYRTRHMGTYMEFNKKKQKKKRKPQKKKGIIKHFRSSRAWWKFSEN